MEKWLVARADLLSNCVTPKNISIDGTSAMHKSLWCQWLEIEARYREAKGRLAQHSKTQRQKMESQAEFLVAHAALSDIFELIWPDCDSDSSCSTILPGPE